MSSPTLNELFPLPEQAKVLHRVVGDWTVEGTLTFEGKPKKVKGTWKFESAAAGWGVLGRMHMDVEGMGAYEEVDILGFDTAEGLFHLFAVTNTAATHDHKGKWLDDDTLNIVFEGLQEGKRFKEDVTVKFVGPREFSIHEVDTLDGQVITTMDVTLRK